MSANTSTTPSAFAAAIHNHSKFDTGDNGAVVMKTSGNVFVDYFTNISRDSSRETVAEAVRQMVDYARHIYNETGDVTYISYLFTFWAFKRSCRAESGEGIRTASHYYLLELYKYFPETVCTMARNGLNGEYGYWKDVESIIILLHEDTSVASTDLYRTYDPLVSALVEGMLEQRHRDLDSLDVWCRENFGRNSRELTAEQISDKMLEDGVKSPNISLVGPWITRERSSDNKKAYWYVGPYDTPVKVTNSCYCVRKLLNTPTKSGEVHVYPVDKQVPFGAMKRYRQANARLAAASLKVEQFICANRWDKIAHNRLPSIAAFRLRKALGNEKLKVAPGPSEHDTGNRYPDDPVRVACRKNMITNLRSGVADSIKTDGLDPHEIATKAMNAIGLDVEFLQATWEEKVRKYHERIETIKAQMLEEGSPEGDTCGGGDAPSATPSETLDAARRSVSGRFIGVADTSGSMTWEGTLGNRPLDIATGLTAFMSEVAAPEYRHVAFSFSRTPNALSFVKNIGGNSVPMTVSERMKVICDPKNVGYNTDIMSLHKMVIKFMTDNKVTEPPTLVIFSDGEFDAQCSTNQGDYNTTHDNVIRLYADAGIKNMATIVYWNLSKKEFNKGTQTSANYPGVMFLQGPSAKNFDFILYGEGAETITHTVARSDGTMAEMSVSSVTAEDTFLKAMDNPSFYKHILNVLNGSEEHELGAFMMQLEE